MTATKKTKTGLKYKIISKELLVKVASHAKAKGISQDMIGERTGFIQSNISRMFSGKYNVKLVNFIKLCEAAEFDWYSELIK